MRLSTYGLPTSGKAERWHGYLGDRVKDYNPATGTIEPDGDLNALRAAVSPELWAYIKARLEAEPDYGKYLGELYKADPGMDSEPPPKPEPPPEPDTGPRIRSLFKPVPT
jgi:hypothetical protein